MCIRTAVFVRILVRAHEHVHTFMHACVCVWARVRVSVSLCLCVSLCVCMCLPGIPLFYPHASLLARWEARYRIMLERNPGTYAHDWSAIPKPPEQDLADHGLDIVRNVSTLRP